MTPQLWDKIQYVSSIEKICEDQKNKRFTVVSPWETRRYPCSVLETLANLFLLQILGILVLGCGLAVLFRLFGTGMLLPFGFVWHFFLADNLNLYIYIYIPYIYIHIYNIYNI